MEVRAGDVVFFRSQGPVAAAQRMLDGADVDRVALALGSNRIALVVGDAIVLGALEQEPSAVRRLKANADLAPVVARAHELAESGPAACGAPEIGLALFAASRKARVTPSWHALQRAAFEAAAAVLKEPTPLTPAQFVWRCFDDALPEQNDVYTLRINDLQNFEVVAGVPANPGAGVSRRYGRGVHPESTLAWAAQPLIRPRLATATGAPVPADLVRACAAWIEECHGGTVAGAPARAEGDALLVSLQKLAHAWSGAQPALAKGTLPAQLELLFRSAADLATPGDLMRCEDLFTV